MNAKTFLAVVVLVLCGLFVVNMQNACAAPPEGPVVLLRSGQVIAGVAREDGDQVIIESENTSIRMPKRSVACWGDSIASLYQYRIDRRSPLSMQNHLNDAKWCLENGLLDEAAKELATAREIGGVSPESDALKRRLAIAREREAEQAKLAAKGVAQVSGTSGNTEPAKQFESLPPQLFSSTSVQRFTNHIQPIMINRCATAGCHGSRPSASPHLDGWRFGTTAAITNRNLQEVGRLIDPRNPLESRLWKMATTPHGNSPALSAGVDQPLRDRLQEWLIIVSGQVGVGASGAANMGMPSSFAPSASELNIAPSGYPASAMTPVLVPESTPSSVPELRPAAPNVTAPPKKLPEVADPFDPEIFNRSYR